MRRILTFNYNLLNAFLGLFRKLLFWPGRNLKNPRNILIFRVGNIGDIICSIPSMIAIRGNFPKAKITLLSSPGKQEMPGAKELLTNAGFLDRLIVYSREEIDTLKKKINLINKLRKIQFDLVVELPPNLGI